MLVPAEGPPWGAAGPPGSRQSGRPSRASSSSPWGSPTGTPGGGTKVRPSPNRSRVTQRRPLSIFLLKVCFATNRSGHRHDCLPVRPQSTRSSCRPPNDTPPPPTTARALCRVSSRPLRNRHRAPSLPPPPRTRPPSHFLAIRIAFITTRRTGRRPLRPPVPRCQIPHLLQSPLSFSSRVFILFAWHTLFVSFSPKVSNLQTTEPTVVSQSEASF